MHYGRYKDTFQNMCRSQRFRRHSVSVWLHMREWHSADTVRSASTLLFSNSHGPRPKLPGGR